VPRRTPTETGADALGPLRVVSLRRTEATFRRSHLELEAVPERCFENHHCAASHGQVCGTAHARSRTTIRPPYSRPPGAGSRLAHCRVRFNLSHFPYSSQRDAALLRRPPQRNGPPVNSFYSYEYAARVSPSGEYLFVDSGRRNSTGIHRIPIADISQLAPLHD